MSEESAPEGSSVDCSSKPCINYSIAESGGGVRRPTTISESLAETRAHIRELQESLDETKEMFARHDAERQALAEKNAARMERDWRRVKWVVSWTPWGKGVTAGKYVVASFGGKAAAKWADDVFLRVSKGGPRLHGDLPHRGALRDMSTARLSELRDMTKISLKTRNREMSQLGDIGGHGRRIGDERVLLENLEDELRNRGAL